jgi:glycosyltransferase A (GT-A) superfamily protein (DUF2064 family)
MPPSGLLLCEHFSLLFLRQAQKNEIIGMVCPFVDEVLREAFIQIDRVPLLLIHMIPRSDSS